MLSLREIAELEEDRQARGVAEIGTASQPIAGGWMTFGGIGSWANQACGLGMRGPVTSEELDRLVEFYVSRGVEPRIEVCPFADASLIEGLGRRGFRLLEFENVLARQLPPGEDLRARHPHGWPAELQLIQVDPNDKALVESFVEVSTRGFRPAGEPLSEVHTEMSIRMVQHPRCDSFLARCEGQDVGGGAMESGEQVAGLFGASVDVAYRRRGIQTALMLCRLVRARQRGCSLAVIHSKPGIPTERNALRLGFFLAYTKVLMGLPTLALLTTILLLLLAASRSDALGAEPERRPNVILVMADDLGWGDVGFNGNRRIRTPHLDQMAAQSLEFTRFYAAAPVCSPTRGSVLTGRHPYRYGVTFANVGFLKPQEVTLAEILRAEGYATGMFGKWHLGSLTTQVQDANRGGPGSEAIFAPPQMHGFDECFCTESKVPTFDPLRVPRRFADGGSRSQGWDALAAGEESDFFGTRYWNQRGEEVGEPLRGDDSRIIMDRALPFIARSVEAGKPFLAVIWFHAPHLPVVAGPEHRAHYAVENVLHRNYFGCVTALDEQVGRLRRTLRELHAAENTLVWFASDNGPEGNARSPGSAGPFRGRKRSLYEGGVRVPALLEWPAKIREPRVTDVPAVTSDYLPTVLDVLGVPHPRPGVPLDGLSLLPLIEGTQQARRAPIGFRSGNMLALSDNRYKLVLPGGNQPAELYDLLADPGESRDLAGEQPEVVDRMRRQLADWVRSCDASANGADYAGEKWP